MVPGCSNPIQVPGVHIKTHRPYPVAPMAKITVLVKRPLTRGVKVRVDRGSELPKWRAWVASIGIGGVKLTRKILLAVKDDKEQRCEIENRERDAKFIRVWVGQ